MAVESNANSKLFYASLLLFIFLASENSSAGPDIVSRNIGLRDGEYVRCAHTYGDLDRTDSLRTLKMIFPPNARVGFVNETGGSFFEIATSDAGFQLHFFTTGLMDLYGIEKKGPAHFCDDGGKTFVYGLEMEDSFIPEFDASGKLRQLTMGTGGPKKTFHLGEMPAPLKKRHPAYQNAN